MEHVTPQQILASRVNEFTTCIRMLLDTGHSLPALILLYSAIDAFASLLRPETKPDTTGDYFKKWTEDYMIGGSGLSIRSEDLWGARCGLLHTHGAASRLSREGKARQLHYYRAQALTPGMQQELESKLKALRAMGKLPVDIDALYAAFDQGVSRFLASIHRDTGLEKRIVHHSSSVFGSWRYVN